MPTAGSSLVAVRSNHLSHLGEKPAVRHRVVCISEAFLKWQVEVDLKCLRWFWLALRLVFLFFFHRDNMGQGLCLAPHSFRNPLRVSSSSVTQHVSFHGPKMSVLRCALPFRISSMVLQL